MHQLLSSSGAAGGGLGHALHGLSGGGVSSNGGVPDDSLAGNTPKELSDHDDLATAAIVDPYLQFKTHKMNLRHRGPKASAQRALRKIVTDFMRHQNYGIALTQLFEDCDWTQAATNRKSKAWQKSLREHVSFCALHSLFLSPSLALLLRLNCKLGIVFYIINSKTNNASASR